MSLAREVVPGPWREIKKSAHVMQVAVRKAAASARQRSASAVQQGLVRLKKAGEKAGWRHV